MKDFSSICNEIKQADSLSSLQRNRLLSLVNCDNSFENLEFIDPHQDREGLSFITRHIHSTTGLKYTVHHHLVVLQHFPTDSQKK